MGPGTRVSSFSLFFFFKSIFQQHFNIVACFGDRDGGVNKASDASIKKKEAFACSACDPCQWVGQGSA